MANREPLGRFIGILSFALIASSALHAAPARLPWAATSGLHFVEAVVAADNYRAAAGGLAMKTSPSLEVRDFGRTLWVASIEDTRRLKWVLGPDAVLPTRVSTRYMFVIDKLVTAGGDAFDQRFIAQQTASLQEALALAQAYARVGDDLDLREFAARSVPHIQMQLDRVLQIQTQHERSR
jgi:putative membrane protein